MHRVKELRKARGLSIRALALATNLSHTTISRIEKGDRKISTPQAVLLANFFNVSTDYLLGKSAEEIYNGFVSSLRGDFLTETVDTDGAVTQKIADCVPEPIRSRLDVVFVLQHISDPAKLQALYQTARLYSAQADFVVPYDSEDGVK